MHFDDRLETLLAAPVADARDRAVRWRQLVDLVSRAPTAGEATAAIELIRREAFAIDEEVRAATFRAIAGRPLPPALLAIFAAQPVRLAAPLFAGLSLSEAEAKLVLAEADGDVRALVTITADAPAPAQSSPISDMVERVEQLRQRGETPPGAAPATAPSLRLAPRSDVGSFQWESDSSGKIRWVDGVPRGAMIGRPLNADRDGLLGREGADRVAQHYPFIDVPLSMEGVLAGQWNGTGVPAFDPSSGRFLGYRGVARRSDAAQPAAQQREPDLDALREMVHEIKTPLNAIIGFAEIIDGQYLGPAHRRYRERAAGIVGQARNLLDAVEDLDFAATLRAGRSAARGGAAAPSARFSDLFPPIAADIEQCLVAGGGILEVEVDDDRHRCALPPELAQRLLRRLLLSLARLVGQGEAFRLAITRRGAMCLLTIARPTLLVGLDEAQLLDPTFNPAGDEDAPGVGPGFALRLVRGLARVAGGSLVIDDHRITLELPALDG